MNIQPYIYIETLYEGRYCQYSRCKDTSSQHTYIIKQLKPKANQHAEKELLNEFALGKSLSHRNLISYISLGKENEKPYLVLEDIQGISLRQYITSHALSMSGFLSIVKQIVDTSRYLQVNKINDTDFVPDTIWIDPATKSIKYIDLSSCVLSQEKSELSIHPFDNFYRQSIKKNTKKNQSTLDAIKNNTLMIEVSSIIAHEINQPLTAIFTYLQLLISQVRDNKITLENSLNMLNQILKECERVGNILNRIKHLIKKEGLHLELADINVAIKEVVEFLGYNSISTNIVLQLQADLPKANFDKIQIQQVIINLIQNSLEAMRESLTTSPVITISTSLLDDNKILVKVKDDGPGIPQRLHEKIFEPYFTTKGYGTGIGLVISRNIVEAHGGALWLADLPQEKGACLLFTLPIQERCHDYEI
ncbi:MAG TPA: ATP-binding protein [Gammaproteobacteria bacterium]|jgi:nitrogen-specific signal transduction histidine kinase|nr:ATP-binding protein [Gammaproteobacteria bacterium]